MARALWGFSRPPYHRHRGVKKPKKATKGARGKRRTMTRKRSLPKALASKMDNHEAEPKQRCWSTARDSNGEKVKSFFVLANSRKADDSEIVGDRLRDP